MDYAMKYITVGQLKARIAQLVAKGRDKEPNALVYGIERDEHDELEALRDLESELSYCWEDDNATLVNEHHWVDYCEQYAYDSGMIGEKSPLAGCVDWTKWSETMRQDYRTVKLPDCDHHFYVRN